MISVFVRQLSVTNANAANSLRKVSRGSNIQKAGNIYFDKDSWFGFTSEAQEHFSITEL